ncbi:hypothetical protein [Pseudomonas sp. LAMO17WK12:I10]|uniref:hypothetical protein n=2 Tax=unclassified Pseudomonas TaxID=196821 RepID=UPI001179AABC|nr:hypothetical protein [Pseudomonas sp. LAMO17WK12:I10]
MQGISIFRGRVLFVFYPSTLKTKSDESDSCHCVAKLWFSPVLIWPSPPLSMRIIIFRPTSQLKGSWLFNMLLRLDRVIYWFAPSLSMLMGVAGIALCFFGWQQRLILTGGAGVVLLLLAGGLIMLWSNYDWWLFKLSPQRGLNIPLK